MRVKRCKRLLIATRAWKVGHLLIGEAGYVGPSSDTLAIAQDDQLDDEIGVKREIVSAR